MMERPFIGKRKINRVCKNAGRYGMLIITSGILPIFIQIAWSLGSSDSMASTYRVLLVV